MSTLQYHMLQDYEPHEIKLATEIATTLNDRKSIRLHLRFARKYKEKFLLDTLAEVMAKEDSEIYTSRAAYYNFLINHRSKDGGPRP